MKVKALKTALLASAVALTAFTVGLIGTNPASAGSPNANKQVVILFCDFDGMDYVVTDFDISDDTLDDMDRPLAGTPLLCALTIARLLREEGYELNFAFDVGNAKTGGVDDELAQYVLTLGG